MSALPLKIVVLISGNGSNLQAIIDAVQANKIDVVIQAVISNKACAFGLERARLANIPCEVIEAKDFPSRNSYDAALLDCLNQYEPALIVLSGFMRILGPDLVAHFPNRIINIHPSLLPKYPGLNTYQRALDAGDKEHGTTVHFVIEALDAGPIIAKEKLEILSGDTPEALQKRVQALEHQLYPQVIGDFAKRRLHFSNIGVESGSE